MSQPFSSRDDIKIDPLQEWLKQALEWIAAHRQTFFSIVGTIAVAVVVVIFVIANLRNVRKEAWQKYSDGQNWAHAKNATNALNFYNEVINNYSHTPAAVYALLAKGDMLYQERKFQEAVESYKSCIEKGPQRIILPFVYSGMGMAQEDMGDYPGATTTYKQFISEFPDHYLAPKIYESSARVYELALNPDAAKEIYEKIITMFPGTPWADKARMRYQALAPQLFQQASPSQNAAPPVGK